MDELSFPHLQSYYNNLLDLELKCPIMIIKNYSCP